MKFRSWPQTSSLLSYSRILNAYAVKANPYTLLSISVYYLHKALTSRLRASISPPLSQIRVRKMRAAEVITSNTPINICSIIMKMARSFREGIPSHPPLSHIQELNMQAVREKLLITLTTPLLHYLSNIVILRPKPSTSISLFYSRVRNTQAVRADFLNDPPIICSTIVISSYFLRKNPGFRSHFPTVQYKISMISRQIA